MRLVLIFLIFILSQSAKAQLVSMSEFDSIIKTADLSNLWCSDSVYVGYNNLYKAREEPFGFIGANYQRLRIHFISVIKNQEKPHNYFVYGKTKVKDNICAFQGEIKIDSLIKNNYSEDADCKSATIYGTYMFYEDPDKKGTGIFKGSFTTKICFDPINKIFYNWIALGADGYRNNQFIGNWTSYFSGNSKTCNWGDYRMPNSSDFDIGAAELSPNPNYYEYGWDFYKIVNDESDKSKLTGVIAAEFSKWWLK